MHDGRPVSHLGLSSVSPAFHFLQLSHVCVETLCHPFQKNVGEASLTAVRTFIEFHHSDFLGMFASEAKQLSPITLRSAG